MERGLQSLAFEAAGATGPLGRVAEGLLKFGGGTGLVLGVAGGIGLVVGALNLLTAGTREAEQAQKDLITQLDRLVPHAKAAGERITIGALQRRRDEPTFVESVGDVLSDFWGDMTGGTGRTGRREGLNQQIATAQNELATAMRDAAKDLKKQTEENRRAALARAQLGLEAQIAAGTLRTVIPEAGARVLKPGFTQAPGFKPEKFEPRVFFLQDLVKGGGKLGPERVDTAHITAEALALLGALKQGGAAGILGAGAGIASDLGGLRGAPKFLGPLGIGLSVASGIFGLFDHSEERRHKELLAAMKDLRPVLQGRAITVNVVSATTGEVIKSAQYEIGRREDRDAIDRDGRAAA